MNFTKSYLLFRDALVTYSIFMVLLLEYCNFTKIFFQDSLVIVNHKKKISGMVLFLNSEFKDNRFYSLEIQFF